MTTTETTSPPSERFGVAFISALTLAPVRHRELDLLGAHRLDAAQRLRERELVERDLVASRSLVLVLWLCSTDLPPPSRVRTRDGTMDAARLRPTDNPAAYGKTTPIVETDTDNSWKSSYTIYRLCVLDSAKLR